MFGLERLLNKESNNGDKANKTSYSPLETLAELFEKTANFLFPQWEEFTKKITHFLRGGNFMDLINDSSTSKPSGETNETKIDTPTYFPPNQRLLIGASNMEAGLGKNGYGLTKLGENIHSAMSGRQSSYIFEKGLGLDLNNTEGRIKFVNALKNANIKEVVIALGNGDHFRDMPKNPTDEQIKSSNFWQRIIYTYKASKEAVGPNGRVKLGTLIQFNSSKYLNDQEVAHKQDVHRRINNLLRKEFGEDVIGFDQVPPAQAGLHPKGLEKPMQEHSMYNIEEFNAKKQQEIPLNGSGSTINIPSEALINGELAIQTVKNLNITGFGDSNATILNIGMGKLYSRIGEQGTNQKIGWLKSQPKYKPEDIKNIVSREGAAIKEIMEFNTANIASNSKIVALYAGYNDHFNSQKAVDEGLNRVSQIVEKILATGRKVMIASLPITSEKKPWNEKYNELVRAKYKNNPNVTVFDMNNGQGPSKSSNPHLPKSTVARGLLKAGVEAGFFKISS